jgi:uncharacterized membrane protein required for colicin V production
MTLDLIALAILAAFAGIGALRGGVASAMGLVTLVASYAAAVWAAQSLGTPLAEKTGMSPLLAPVLAGTATFFGTAVVVGGLGALVRHGANRMRGDAPMGAASRWAGAAIGLVRGSLVVVLVSYGVIWLDAARQSGAFEGLEAVPDIRISSAAKVTEKLVEKTVSATVDSDPTTADVIARLAARPGVAVKSIQAILSDRRIEALQQDRFFWTLVENGAYRRAMTRDSFRAISRDPEMRARFADVGVVDASAVADARVFEERFAEVLGEVGPRVKGLANDPDLQALASDPQVTAMLENGDTLGLFQHEGIQDLVAKVTSRP